MKKRLRKKLRRGEFAEYGFYLECQVDPRVFFTPTGLSDVEAMCDVFFDWEEKVADFFHQRGYCIAFGGDTAAGRMDAFVNAFGMNHSKRRPKRMTVQDRDWIISQLPEGVPGFIASYTSELVDIWGPDDKKHVKLVDEFFRNAEIVLNRKYKEWAERSNIPIIENTQTPVS